MFKKFSKKQSPLNKISALALSTALVVSMLGTQSALAAGIETEANGVETQAAGYAVKDLSLNPGSDVSQLNFAWYSSGGAPTASIVQVAKKADVVGDVFPADKAVEFRGSSKQAVTVAGVVFYSNKVTATDLDPTTEYVYRYGDGDDNNWSDFSNYTTLDPNNYTFMFVGDPQIGTGGNGGIAQDGASWARTLNIATTNFPQIDYVMSGGDQIDATGYTDGVPNNDLPIKKGTNDPAIEYDEFLAPEQLKSLPFAPAVGNHDVEANYDFHYNVPNRSNLGAQVDSKFTSDPTATYGGDYWYTNGDALYMVLNTNNSNYADHNAFLKEATDANPNAKWRIATFHHDVYGAGDSHSQSDSLTVRNWLQPVLDKYDIDLVFTGHDHSYARSVPMYDGKVQTGTSLKDSEGNDLNPAGTTYFTGNSATGSKYYDLVTTNLSYIAKKEQNKLPSFVIVNVTGTKITYNAYEINTDGTVADVDSYSLVKKPEDVKVYAKDNDTTSAYYAVKNASAVKDIDTTFTFDSTQVNLKKAELVTPDAGSFEVDTTKAGEVNIKATLATPISSEDYKDVIKLTFEAADGKKSAKANVELAKSELTTLNKHIAKDSNVEAKSADVVVTNQPNVKVYSEKSRIVGGKAEFYIALSNTDDVNAMDATFHYDNTKFTLEAPELIGQDDQIKRFNDDHGNVHLIAGFTTPISSVNYTNVVKLTLAPKTFDKFVQADIKLDKVTTSSEGINTEVLNNTEQDAASIVIHSTYQDLVDITGDGKADIGDLSKAIQYYRTTSADPEWNDAKRADVVEDNVIDTADFTLIMTSILSK